MSKTNCVNCGHGKDPDAIKCPFCGTTYFDMTGIDVSGKTPVILMLKNYDGSVFQMKAYPTSFTLMMSQGEPLNCDLGFTGYKPKLFIEPEPWIEGNISFNGY